MTRTRLMLLGLCAALFAVMAFSASGAQAAKWLILTSGGVVKTGEELKAEVTGEVDKKTTADLTLDSEVLKIPTKVLCTAFTVTGVSLEGAGKITEGGKVTFTGCTILLKGELNEKCKPKAGGGEPGKVITNEGKGALVLSGTEGLTKIEPKTAGGAFATLELGAECPIGEKLPVNGILYVKDGEGKIETHLVKHLIEEAKPPSELWVTNNNNAEHKANILGSALVFLAGAHNTLAWGGMPE
jgi:hypothetical protein